MGPSRQVFSRIKRTLEKIHLYPDPACTHLRSLLSATLGVDRGQILVGNGSQEILMLIAAGFSGEGDNIVASEPAFPPFQSSSRIFGAETRRCPLEAGRIRVDRLAGLVDARTRAVYVSNPNSSTGSYLTRAEIEWLLRAVAGNVLVILDEAYVEYADAQDFPASIPLLRDFSNLLILRTFSKAFGLAGLRIGYALAHADLVSRLDLPKNIFNVNRLAQAAAMAALEDTHHLNLIRLANREGKAYLYRHLDRLGVPYFPSQGNFVFLILGPDHADAAGSLDQAAVTVRPFHLGGSGHALRVSVGTSYGNRRFIEGLEEYLGAKRTAAKTVGPDPALADIPGDRELLGIGGAGAPAGKFPTENLCASSSSRPR